MLRAFVKTVVAVMRKKIYRFVPLKALLVKFDKAMVMAAAAAGVTVAAVVWADAPMVGKQVH